MTQDICPVCSSRDVLDLGQPKFGPSSVRRCWDCQSEFLSPQPTDERLNEIYGPSYYAPWGFETAEIVRRSKQLTFERAISFASLPQKAVILELGCGTGDFAEFAIHQGFAYHGLDVNSVAIAEVQERCPKAQLFCGTLEKSPWASTSFQAIVMFDFIEHVRDPGHEISLASQNLAEGGCLIASTPRTDSISRRVLGRLWPQYREEHLTLLSSDGLRRLLERHGFTVEVLVKTKKFVSLNYLNGQLHTFPIPVIGSLLKVIWRLIPLPKARPIPLYFGEMTVVARRTSKGAQKQAGC